LIQIVSPFVRRGVRRVVIGANGFQQRGTDQTGFTPADVGKISLSMSKYEGEIVSTGTLTMNGTDYKVLLTSPINLKIGRER